MNARRRRLSDQTSPAAEAHLRMKTLFVCGLFLNPLLKISSPYWICTIPLLENLSGTNGVN